MSVMALLRSLLALALATGLVGANVAEAGQIKRKREAKMKRRALKKAKLGGKARVIGQRLSRSGESIVFRIRNGKNSKERDVTVHRSKSVPVQKSDKRKVVERVPDKTFSLTRTSKQTTYTKAGYGKKGLEVTRNWTTYGVVEGNVVAIRVPAIDPGQNYSLEFPSTLRGHAEIVDSRHIDIEGDDVGEHEVLVHITRPPQLNRQGQMKSSLLLISPPVAPEIQTEENTKSNTKEQTKEKANSQKPQRRGYEIKVEIFRLRA
jgi:hypothetical protein